MSLAAGLQTKLNLKMKDIVAIALPNCLDYPIIGMAINLAGATATLINPAQTICNNLISFPFMKNSLIILFILNS